MCGLIRRIFHYLDEKTFVPLYKSLVRTQFDYASPVWSSYKPKKTKTKKKQKNHTHTH